MQKILRLPEVLPVTGSSIPTIWRWIRLGKFPRPVKLGENLSGWLEEEVVAWQNARIAERDARVGSTRKPRSPGRKAKTKAA